MRFRNYLAEQYKKKEKINDKNLLLPIITIYILGFKLPELHTPCIKIERNYRDLINKKIITQKSDFVEQLTHDCFIVQVDRITNKYQTKLDKLLSVFEQTNFLDDTQITKEYNHNTDLEEVEIITSILHYTGTNPTEKRKIEVEQEAWRTVEAMFEERAEKLIKELSDSKKALLASEKLIKELRKKLEEK